MRFSCTHRPIRLPRRAARALLLTATVATVIGLPARLMNVHRPPRGADPVALATLASMSLEDLMNIPIVVNPKHD